MSTPSKDFPASIARRRFLKQSAVVGGGLTLGFYLPVSDAKTAASTDAAATEVNAWVIVRPDNSITIRYARAEIGQGTSTAAPMMVGEELECDWKQVRMEFASASEQVKRDNVWGSTATFGSQGIRTSQEYLRKAGASARMMLVTAAAERWQVPASECVAKLSVITHTPSGRKLTYGQVAAAAGKLQPPKDVPLKDPKDWTLIGKAQPRFDIPDVVMGRLRYGIDAQLPGMVYAAVVQSPVHGGKVKSVDEEKLQGRRGFIKVVPIENGVAVVADNWWRASQMAKDLSIEWDEGGNGEANTASITEHMRGGLDAAGASVARDTGDVAQAFKAAAKTIEADYFTPYLAHATLEPQVCTALVKDGRVEVWPSTQDVSEVLKMAATAADVPPANVEVHRLHAGGGFGRRYITQEYVRQAVAIAKAMPGTPVKMLWSREQDTQHDYFRPMAFYRMRAALDADGTPTAWTTRIVTPSLLGTLLRIPLPNGIDRIAVGGYANFPYAVPNQHMDYLQRNGHVHVGFWRAVGESQNPFARESFVDELAHAAGKDPYQYRRGLLAKEPKALAVLDAVAKAAGWDQPLPNGVFRGIASTEGTGSYTASVIEVSVDEAGTLKVHRIVTAIDSGYVVNPDTVVAQIEGSAVFALTAALHGEITIKDGRVEQSNFHDYPMLRMADIPKIEVVQVPSGGFWGGVGEPGVNPIAPALCNAIFAATGQRIRALPVKNHDLKKTA